MAAEWHPVQNAHACEWVLRDNPFEEPYGVIRELQFGPGRTEVWYRLVSWSADPARRQLLGYAKSAKVLAELAWTRRIELSRASRLADVPSGAPTRPR